MTDAAAFGTYAPKGFARRAIETTRALPDTWLGRRGVIVMRRFVTPRLGGAPVDIEALGLRMRVKPYNNICEKRMLFAPKTFDPQELAILSDRIGPGFSFIDVGANVGAYALFVALKAGQSARILAIEPQPDIFERLIYNIGLNEFATIKALACAVAERAGEVTLFLDPKNAGESSVKLVNSGGATPIRIPAKPLLEIAQSEGYERIDAIKLDVEGAEDLVLEPFLAGAPEGLLPRLLIVEDGSERWQADLPGLLGAKDYHLLAKTRLNLVFERTRAGKGGAGHG